MKLTLNSLLLLLASATAFAQFPSPLKNIVVIVQENCRPDNLFHSLTPACPIPTGAPGLRAYTPAPVTNRCYDISPCGLSNQGGTVHTVPLTAVPLSGSYDPSHSHSAFENKCDTNSSFLCRNDGAWKIVTSPANGSYGYVDNPAVVNYNGSSGHPLDPYLTFARQYGWANFMFQTNQEPSYPAHQFLFSGTAALTNDDDLNSIFVSENFSGTAGSGCLAAPSTASHPVSSSLLQPNNGKGGCIRFDAKSEQECRLFNTTAVYPNQPVGTFGVSHKDMGTTVLDPNAISWKYYAPAAGSIWTAPNAIQQICQPQFVNATTLECSGAEWQAKVDINNLGTDILRDITKCTLPNVSWVIPNGAWSDHAGPNDQYGPSWVTAIINAIGNNPTCAASTPDAGQNFWHNTAIVVTWEDWGGWSDNQPAKVLGGLPCQITTPPTPCLGDDRYGSACPCWSSRPTRHKASFTTLRTTSAASCG